jgi:hypothetical protein
MINQNQNTTNQTKIQPMTRRVQCCVCLSKKGEKSFQRFSQCERCVSTRVCAECQVRLMSVVFTHMPTYEESYYCSALVKHCSLDHFRFRCPTCRETRVLTDDIEPLHDVLTGVGVIVQPGVIFHDSETKELVDFSTKAAIKALRGGFIQVSHEWTCDCDDCGNKETKNIYLKATGNDKIIE